jgi:hypothetical protein
MPGERSTTGKRGQGVPDEPRVIAEARDASHLTVGGDTASWHPPHDRIDACVRRRRAVVNALLTRLRAAVPHE